MPYKLSQFGLSREEQDLLSSRLHPLVNKVFLENIAKMNNIKLEDIETPDYTDNDIFKAEQFNRRREINAKRNIESKDTGYYNIEDAKKYDKISNHKLLKEDGSRLGRYEGLPKTQFKIDAIPEEIKDYREEIFIDTDDEKEEKTEV